MGCMSRVLYCLEGLWRVERIQLPIRGSGGCFLRKFETFWWLLKSHSQVKELYWYVIFRYFQRDFSSNESLYVYTETNFNMKLCDVVSYSSLFL